MADDKRTAKRHQFRAIKKGWSRAYENEIHPYALIAKYVTKSGSREKEGNAKREREETRHLGEKSRATRSGNRAYKRVLANYAI